MPKYLILLMYIILFVNYLSASEIWHNNRGGLLLCEIHLPYEFNLNIKNILYPESLIFCISLRWNNLKFHKQKCIHCI
jgi:hypothetical protein